MQGAQRASANMMNVKSHFSGLSFFAVALISLGCEAQGAVQWQYRPITSVRREVVIESNGTVGIGPAGFEATFCAPADALICFRSAPLSFAVPRDIAEDSSWDDNGVKYRVTERRREMFLGEEFDAYFISAARDDGNDHSFVFSPARGLLSISIKDGAAAVQLVSIEYCGFGAPKACVAPESLGR
jgi:hypothetical protein